MARVDFLMNASGLATLSRTSVPPLIVLDMDAEVADLALGDLPPCPVIGVGSPDHPVARQLDSVIETPVALASLIDTILARPRTAGILVQLLRMIEGLPVERALVAESLAFSALQASSEHRDWLMQLKAAPVRSAGKLRISREADVLKLVLDRADALNAIDVGLRDSLREAFEMAALDDSIDRIELSAAGRAFGVGADLGEFGTTTDPVTAHHIRMQTVPAHAAARCAQRLSVTVQGLCVGASLELAAFAARVEAQSSAIFQLPELKMGLIAGAGGCVSVSRRIGRQRTALMILSGRRIGAQTALKWGLIDAIVD